MKEIAATEVAAYRNGTWRLMKADESGDLFLVDQAEVVICGPVSLEGAMLVAADILDGHRRTITDPMSTLCLAMVLSPGRQPANPTEPVQKEADRG